MNEEDINTDDLYELVPQRTGAQTSEFWLTIMNKAFVFIVGMTLLIMVANGRLTIDQVTDLMPLVVATIAGTTVGTGSYSIARGLAKNI
jgi:hypothetical protein